jgi:hypothetical protein
MAFLIPKHARHDIRSPRERLFAARVSTPRGNIA